MTKYGFIKEDIRKQISEYSLKPNQVIMTESEMCNHYGVSRITVRKAIDELCAEGILYRIRGKGCFVRNQTESKRSRIYSFTEAVINDGKKPSKKLLSMKKRPATEKEAGQLEISVGNEVYVLRSLYFADEQPFSVNTAVLPVEMFPKLDFFNFNDRSLYEVLRTFFQIEMYRVKQNLFATTGSEEVTELLEVDRNHPLLRIEAVSNCIEKNEERPFEYYEAYIQTGIQNYYVEKFNS